MEADLRELARLPDVLAVCSSAGWTDQRHVLYLSLLQESFVNQLHEGEIGFRGLFNPSPRTSQHKESSKFMKKAEQVRPTSSEHRKEDGQVHSTDDDASSTETVQESSSSSQAGATSCSGQPSSSSTSHCGNRKDSLSGTTAEGSDQNFVDGDTEGSGESRRRRDNKRLKSADDTVDDQARERRCIHEEGGTAASGLPQWKKRRGHRWP